MSLSANRPRALRALLRFAANEAAISTVEFAILTPSLVLILGVILFGGMAFEMQRKVTLVARTITDLATRQADLSSSTRTYTVADVLGAAATVILPYDPALMSMVISEVKAPTAGANTQQAIVQWSRSTGSAAALRTGSVLTLPQPNMSSQGYLVVGTVTYLFKPLDLGGDEFNFTLSQTIYLMPRVSESIVCCD